VATACTALPHLLCPALPWEYSLVNVVNASIDERRGDLRAAAAKVRETQKSAGAAKQS
jgi:hypothetical protein